MRCPRRINLHINEEEEILIKLLTATVFLTLIVRRIIVILNATLVFNW